MSVITVRWLALISCLFFLTTLARASETLIVGITENQRLPYVELQNGKLSGGILKELTEQLGQQLNIDIQFMVLPRKRLQQQLLQGQLHLLPHANPAWLPNADQFLWSKPWLYDEDILVASSAAPVTVQRIDQLHGLRIGTILGYHYPELEFFFEHQLLLRDDAHDLKQNFQRLAAGRIDLLVDSRVMIDYQLHHQLDASQFQVTGLVAATNHRYLALSRTAPVTIKQLNNALAKLQRENRIEQLLENYR